MKTQDVEALIERLIVHELPAAQYLGFQIKKTLRARYVEQVRYAGLPMAFRANAGHLKRSGVEPCLYEGFAFREMTVEDLKPYQDALNEVNAALWKLLEKAHFFGHLEKSPGKTPVASYDPNKHCDSRCWGASGFICECKCGGAFHAMGLESVKLAMGLNSN